MHLDYIVSMIHIAPKEGRANTASSAKRLLLRGQRDSPQKAIQSHIIFFTTEIKNLRRRGFPLRMPPDLQRAVPNEDRDAKLSRRAREDVFCQHDLRIVWIEADDWALVQKDGDGEIGGGVVRRAVAEGVYAHGWTKSDKCRDRPT